MEAESNTQIFKKQVQSTSLVSKAISIIFALLVASVLLAFASTQQAYPQWLPARLLLGPLCLSTMLLLARRDCLLCILFFLCGSVAFGLISPEILRLSTVGILISWTAPLSIIPPFLLLPIFSVAWVLFAPGAIPPAQDPLFFLNCMLESITLLIVGLLRFTPPVQYVARENFGQLSAAVFFVHFAAFFTFLGLGVLGLLIARFDPQLFDGLIVFFKNLGLPLLVVICALVLFPLLAGFLAALASSRSLLTLVERSAKRSTDTLTEGPLSVIPEWDRLSGQVLENLGTLLIELRHVEAKLLEARHEKEKLERRLIDRDTTAFRTLKVVDEAPWGIVACTDTKHILALNRTLGEILDIPAHEFSGRDLSAFDSAENPWRHELAGLLAWACQNVKTFVDQELHRYQLSSQNGFFLDVSLRAFPETSARVKRNPLEPQEQAVLCAFIRKLPDLRDFQLHLLTGSQKEIIGRYFPEFAGSLALLLQEANQQLHSLQQLLERLERSGECKFSQSGDGLDLLLAANNLNRNSRAALEELERLINASIGTDEEHRDIDLGKLIEDALLNFSELRCQGVPIPLTFAGTQQPKNGQSPQIKVSVGPTDIYAFLACFLSSLRYLLEQNSQLNISIGEEVIDQQAAELIVGSRSGVYAWIVISHPGQSITANMFTKRLVEVVLGDHQASTLETSLMLLKQQVRKLEGFTSIQSSASKGTVISIYLPVAAAERQAALHRPPALSAQPSTKVSLASKPRALLVGSEDSLVRRWKDMLLGLGYHVELIHCDLLLEELREPLDFGGSGFENKTSSLQHKEATKQGAKKTSRQSAPAFVLLEANSLRRDAASLFRHLESEYPEALRFFLLAEGSELPFRCSSWIRLAENLSSSQLQEIITSLSR